MRVRALREIRVVAKPGGSFQKIPQHPDTNDGSKKQVRRVRLSGPLAPMDESRGSTKMSTATSDCGLHP
jgi:hypothetical protein